MNKAYKSIKKSKNVAHTQYDNRYTQSNRINNMNNKCSKCGTCIIATEETNKNALKTTTKITVTCGNYTTTQTISGCINYIDVFCSFVDEHP